MSGPGIHNTQRSYRRVLFGWTALGSRWVCTTGYRIIRMCRQLQSTISIPFQVRDLAADTETRDTHNQDAVARDQWEHTHCFDTGQRVAQWPAVVYP